MEPGQPRVLDVSIGTRLIGPVPVVVNAETLFTPIVDVRLSGYGIALNRATTVLCNSVLSTGLLPGRGTELGWCGVDVSGTGALESAQPTAVATL